MEWGIGHPNWPWRNRKGNPISSLEASQLFTTPDGFQKRIVGNTTLGPFEISTVHLVTGHPCGGCDAKRGWCMGAFFETMVFVQKEGKQRYEEWDGRQWRYHRLVEAIRGHERVMSELAVLVEDD